MSYKEVTQLEDNNIIPNAVYYHNVIPTVLETPRENRKDIRNNWHNNALKVLTNVELVFCDPDNGSIGNEKRTRKNGEKYASLGELADYYTSGKDIVYYCHKARRNPDAWKKKRVEFLTECPDAKIIVLTFHRGTQRSYIFGIHSENYEKYNKLIEQFRLTNWGTVSVDRKNRFPENCKTDKQLVCNLRTSFFLKTFKDFCSLNSKLEL